MDRPQNEPLSLEEAKQALFEEPAPGEATSLREWIARHPERAVAIAAGAGLVLAVFPRVRRIALPLAIAVIRHAML